MLTVIPARISSRNIIDLRAGGGARVAGDDTAPNVIGAIGLGIGGYFMLKGAVMTGAIVIGAALFTSAWMQRSKV